MTTVNNQAGKFFNRINDFLGTSGNGLVISSKKTFNLLNKHLFLSDYMLTAELFIVYMYVNCGGEET